jgi:hypothetical protein
MEEWAHTAGLARKNPDVAGALYAVTLAGDLLESAGDKFSRKDYPGAFEDSRNAMRLASSALLLRDGYVSDSLETTISYLFQRYPGELPLDEWHRFEEAAYGSGYGLYFMILKAMGKVKKTGEQEAYEAMSTAMAFINSTRAEMRR